MTFEPERYELTESEPDRRDFFKWLGAGLVVLLAASDGDAQESGQPGRRRGGATPPQDLSAWLHVGEDGRITFFTGKVEVGQNARTSLTQAVAEELHAPAASISLLMGDTEVVPFDMGTFGSLSTPQMAPQMRRAAATAREWMIELAAERLHRERAGVTIEDALAVKDLLKGKALVRTVGKAMVSKPKCESVPKVDGRSFVTGKHKYTSDLKLPGMTAGKPPREAWKAEGPAGAELFEHLRRTAKTQPKNPLEFSGTEQKLEATYRIAYIAHVPLEPRAAVAEWNGDKLTVYTGTQRPFGVRTELAQAFQVPETKVRVIVPDTGSGYGGKHTGECAIEAARLAKTAARPVKVVWTRQEEFAWAYWRPAGVIDIRAALDGGGLITAWEFHNYNSGNSGIGCPYAVEKKQIEFHPSVSPLRQGSYRGLAATANNFARESHIDDLAKLARMDPLEFRLRNLKDDRMKGVLQAAARKFGWVPAKGGKGIACGFEKNGYVATCAEIEMERGRVRVRRLTTAFDCGAVVNPEHLKNQIEGAVIMGIGGALFEHAEFESGRLITDRLSKYRVPRFSDVPEIETVLVDRKDIPSAGAGETPIIGVAPAIANAIFAATGERRRQMPLEKPEQA